MQSIDSFQSPLALYPLEFPMAAGQKMQDIVVLGIEQLQQRWFENTREALDQYRDWIEGGYTLQIACLMQYQQWLTAGSPASESCPAVPGDVQQAVIQAAAAAPADAAPVADDLTRIQGLGKVLRQRLGEAGVVSFSQIVAWSEADIARIEAEVLGSRFSGRIARDQWQAQAEELLGQG